MHSRQPEPFSFTVSQIRSFGILYIMYVFRECSAFASRALSKSSKSNIKTCGANQQLSLLSLMCGQPALVSLLFLPSVSSGASNRAFLLQIHLLRKVFVKKNSGSLAVKSSKVFIRLDVAGSVAGRSCGSMWKPMTQAWVALARSNIVASCRHTKS